MAKIIILGGGLTGLSTAYHLEQAGFYDYELYEQEERPGGLLRSVNVDDFTFDFSGHLLHINNDYFRSFLDSVVGFDNLDFVARRSAIFSHNVFSLYPYQMNLYGLPADVIYDCITGFLKRKKRINPRTFYDWVLKHFGAGFGKHFFFPFQQKILSYNVKQFSAAWTGRFVPHTSLKQILQGALHKPVEHIGYNHSFYYPKKDGIEYIIKKIAKKLINPIATDYRAEKIDLTTKTVSFSNGVQRRFDHLISTAPLDELLMMLKEPSHLNLKNQADKLVCASVMNINLGFKKEYLSDKHWIYFPEKKYSFYRMGFWHNLCPALVPQNHTAVYGELSYHASGKTKNSIEKLARKGVKDTLTFLNLTEQDITIHKTLHLKHAYVVYTLWREKNLNRILEQLKENNISSIGRFGEWKYSSMQEAVLDGKKAADQHLALLTITSRAKNTVIARMLGREN